MFTKKNHADSTLPKTDNQYHLFIGRWQPLHDGHKAMFQQVLDTGGNILIAIRRTVKNEKNPYHSYEVEEMIIREYKELYFTGRVQIIVIPDIQSVNFGRGVGYDIVEWIPPEEIAMISATKIREEMKANGQL